MFSTLRESGSVMKILFVYGTLQRGECSDISRKKPAPRYLGEGRVRGWLYDLGHCPALVLDEAGPVVQGEVFELESSLFDELDEWEAKCGEFALVEHPVSILSTAEVSAVKNPATCLIYHWGGQSAPVAKLVASGRWHGRQGVAA